MSRGWKAGALLLSLAAPGARAQEPVAARMIEVDVQVLEVNRGKLTQVGLDWRRLLEGGLGTLAPVSPLHVVEGTPPSLEEIGTFARGRVDAFVQAIQEKDYGKLLAKPKLLTADGATASFLAGGEIPVVTQDSLGRTSVSWKEYGVKLRIKPERRGALIRTTVRAEVSTVDPTRAVILPNGTYIPAVKSRWAETEVELNDKATVVIAGLIQSDEVSVKRGVPLLSDIPLLGWLFRHTRTERLETELIIFVSPSLVSQKFGAAGAE